jgi:hypothetical protein
MKNTLRLAFNHPNSDVGATKNGTERFYWRMIKLEQIFQSIPNGKLCNFQSLRCLL